MKKYLDALIVDDNPDDALLVACCIEKGGYRLTYKRVEDEAQMIAMLRQRTWDAVICDVSMPHFDAASALAIWQGEGLDCPFIVVSGAVGEEAAVSLLKAGAHDFVLKGNMSRLVPALERELREAEVRRAKKRAEAALRDSEARYARACEGANDGIWDWDLVSNTVYYSRRWKEMVGYGEGEIGHSPEEWFSRIVPEADGEAVRAELDRHLAGAMPQFAVEHRMRHRDGGSRWVLVRGQAAYDENGKAVGIAGSASDITARKLTEQELHRTKDELEDALAAKTRFLAAASHDLRQPVQTLFCYAWMLRERLSRSDALVQLVYGMDDSLASLKSLLDSLLDVSKLDAGLVEPEIREIPVMSVISAAASQLRPLAAARGIELRVVPSTCTVMSDPVLLERILANLADNAIRYTDHGRVLIGCRRYGLVLSLEVWDTGIGIANELQERIFEEFYQIGNQERDRRKGLGLGLAIVQRLCRLLRYDLQLRSQPGHGSMFAVHLPLAAASANFPCPLGQPSSMAGKGKILVIDDEKAVADTLAAVLASWGYEPIPVNSGSDALANVASCGCDLAAVIADYRLRAGETGAAVLARIHDRCRRYIPSVILTGDTAPERLCEARYAGAVLLHKPVHPADIRQALATVMDREVPPSKAEGRPES